MKIKIIRCLAQDAENTLRPKGKESQCTCTTCNIATSAKLELIASLKKEMRIFELDNEAHGKGYCSFNVTALCSAEEQRIKRYFSSLLDQSKL